jgi:hypothetical protein
MSGHAVKQAGERVKAQLLEMAGEMMSVDQALLGCRTQ